MFTRVSWDKTDFTGSETSLHTGGHVTAIKNSLTKPSDKMQNYCR